MAEEWRESESEPTQQEWGWEVEELEAEPKECEPVAEESGKVETRKLALAEWQNWEWELSKERGLVPDEWQHPHLVQAE